MNKGRPRWWNLWFHRFFIEAILNIRQPYLSNLTSKDRLNIKKLDNFVITGSLDDKLDLLGRIGYRFALVVVDQKNSEKMGLNFYARLFKIFRRKTSFDKKAAIVELKQTGMFVLVDGDFVKSMALTSDIYNSASFNEVSKYVGAHDNLFSYNKRMLEFKKNLKAITDVDKLISNIMRLGTSMTELEQFKNNFLIDFSSYRVLAELSANRTTKHSKLKEIFPTPYLPKMIKALKDNNLIDDMSIGNETSYRITGTGEDRLSKAREYIINFIYKI